MASRPLLSFLDYQQLTLRIEPDQAFDRGRPQSAQIETTFGISRHESERQKFLVVFTCHLFRTDENANLPYEVEVGLHGEFYSNLQLGSDGVPARAVLNALSLLYGVGRGIVGQATGGGVNGRFVLPTVTFDELVYQAINNPESQVTADEGTAPPKALPASRPRKAKKKALE